MNKFFLSVGYLLFVFFIFAGMTTITYAADSKIHPTCEQTSERVLKPYINRLISADKALAEYETKLAERIQKIRDFMTQLNETSVKFDAAQKKDLGKLDTNIGYMLEAVDEIRARVMSEIAKLNQRASEFRVAGRESEANRYTQSARKLADRLASAEASGYKKELGWSASITGWRKQVNKTRLKRNKRAEGWSAGSINIHISFLGYSISWAGVQKRLVKEREKLASSSRREPGFHLSPLGYTLTGLGIDDLVKKRNEALNDARSRIANGTFRLHIPIFGFTADRNYAQERMDKAKAKLQNDTAAWGSGTYKAHSRTLGYTTTNGYIQKNIQKKKTDLADFIAGGNKSRVHVPLMGYTSSGDAILERIQKAKTAKDRALWQQRYGYWKNAIAKAIEKKRADIKKWEEHLEAFKKQWQEDLEKQKKYIDTSLTWALGETPCGGSAAYTVSHTQQLTEIKRPFPSYDRVKQLDRAFEPPVSSPKPVAVVKAMTGDVWYSRSREELETNPRRLKQGDDVKMGYFIKTGKRGRVFIIFGDDIARVSIGSNSVFYVKRYIRKVIPEGNRIKNTFSAFELLKGFVRVITGALFGSGDNINVETRNSVAGCRGTNFLVGHDEASATDIILVKSGVVDVIGRTSGHVMVNAGEQVRVRNGTPEFIAPLDEALWLQHMVWKESSFMK